MPSDPLALSRSRRPRIFHTIMLMGWVITFVFAFLHVIIFTSGFLLLYLFQIPTSPSVSSLFKLLIFIKIDMTIGQDEMFAQIIICNTNFFICHMVHKGCRLKKSWSGLQKIILHCIIKNEVACKSMFKLINSSFSLSHKYVDEL